MKKILMLILPAFVLFLQPAMAGIRVDSLWEKEFDSTEVMNIKYSPDGRYIAVAHRHWDPSDLNRTIINPLLLDAHNGQVVREFTSGHNTSIITTVSFSPDGSLLATGDAPFDSARTLCIWDVQTGQLVRRLLRNDDAVKNYTDILYAEFTKDGRYIVCILESSLYMDPETGEFKDFKDILVFINTQTWQIERISNVNPEGDDMFALSPTSRYYAVEEGDSEFKIINIRNINNDSLIHTFIHTGYTGYLAFSPDSSMLAEMMYDSVRLYNLNTLSFIKDIHIVPADYWDMKFTPNSQYLVVTGAVDSYDSLLRVIDVSNGSVAAVDNSLGCLDFDENGNHLAIGLSSIVRLDSIYYTPMAVKDDPPAGKINVVYPNPVNGMINLIIDEGNTESCHLSIYSTDGKLIDSTDSPVITRNTDGSITINYNTDSLPTGTFWAKVNSSNDAKTFKLIKSK